MTVSPSLAAEGQTVTLTAANGYKFRRVEIDNAPVTVKDNDRLIINMTKLTVPVSWEDAGQLFLLSDDLPGFKAITKEEAAQWVPSESDLEEGAYLIYGFDEEGNALYYATLLGQAPVEGPIGKLPCNNMSVLSNSSNLHLRYYYPSSATVIGDKTEATFLMPAGAANVDCDMVRNMSVDVTATMSATEFSLKKEDSGFVLTEGEGLTAILPDVYDEIGSPLVSMQKDIDYKLRLERKNDFSGNWEDNNELKRGTFRWRIIGLDTYDGEMTSAPFNLTVIGE